MPLREIVLMYIIKNFGVAVRHIMTASAYSRMELKMNISEMLVTMSQSAEIEQPSLFPFPFKIHLIFSCLAVLFFVYQFTKQKKPYQLIMAIAIPFSLVIWLSESKSLFYAVGIVEAVLLLAAFITAVIFREKSPENVPSVADAATSSEEAKSEETESKEVSDEAEEKQDKDSEEE